MANKQYTSPIRLLEYAAVDTTQELNVSRIRKQLSAEFDMSPSGMIEIDGHTYNKEDVLEELASPDFTNRLIYHKKLWEAKELLQWLEKNQLQLDAVDKDFSNLYGDRNFDHFFSPYFAAPFNQTARTLINQLDLEKLGQLLAYEDFLQPADREEAFRAIRIFLDENLRIFRNLSDQNYGAMRPKLSHWIKEKWHGFLNNLPDEFYEEKETLIVELINLTVKIQKWHEKDCKNISAKLILIQDIPAHLRDTIEQNHKVYFKEDPANYRWIFWIIFILLKLFVFRGC